MRKWVIRGSLVLFLGIAAFIADLVTNLGFPFGYYGELNRLIATFNALSGVSIERVGYNVDMTLEEITFWIIDAQGARHQIHFGQNDAIRELSGKQLETALVMRLAERPGFSFDAD